MIEYFHGIRVKGTDLWLDASRRKPLCFISHAHSDHVRRHRTVLATPETVMLCRKRVGIADAITLPYGQEREIGDAVVELFPSGHIHGAAQIQVKKDGRTVIYTGDFKLREGLTAQKAEVRRAEVLIMEATYGRPEYVFPDREEVIGQLCEFLNETLYWDRVPVIFAYSLGKAQEITRILSERGFKLMVHRAIHEISEVYKRTGVTLGTYDLFMGRVWSGHVLLCPPQARHERSVNSIRGKRTAFISGWGLSGRRSSWMAYDTIFPLSDHADFNELIDYARRVQPERILVTHGFREFVYTLRDLGFRADHLIPPEQGELL
ncbi:MAG: MBL fold metallo-hydrolase RNA specificity domain-containing protein [Candidatus Glassbacteria bacterium]